MPLGGRITDALSRARAQPCLVVRSLLPLHLLWIRTPCPNPAQVDYSSIPQKHKGSQLLAINSLALYASIANALIIAVPAAKHVSTNLFADAESYQARAWCRAEQFCYSIGHGANNLWVASSANPTDIRLADSKWLETSLFVFEGESHNARGCRVLHLKCLHY